MNQPLNPSAGADQEIASPIELSTFLQSMARQKGSDLFITVGAPVMMKVSGKLNKLTDITLKPDQARNLVLSVMTPGQREEFEKTHECNFAIGLQGVGRFRVSAFYQRNQVGMVVRRIETTIPTFEDLDLPEVLKKLAMVKRGIVLMVGATGTGKSTTLAAMLGYRNQNSSGHIITIEDPIEFVHKHIGCVVTQREVGIDTDSWENALKNTLRQAPDVIMIGEIRTREGMEYAVSFAETGHLVLCTLHANNANQAIERILNFFPDERKKQLLMDLSLNLKGVVAQQLVPSPKGGRKAILEILLGEGYIQDLIRDGEISKIKEMMKQGKEQGMQTFDMALTTAYFNGEISYDDALRFADSQNEVRLAIKLRQGTDGKDLSGLEIIEQRSPHG
jgi:twitching motility protein PilU